MRILLITQWFDPEPTFKGLVFARELVRQGFEVEVLTGYPNYPGGRLYPGYRIRLLQRELVDGVQITRVPLYPSHDSSAARRVLNYLSFAASALIYGMFRARRADVIYAYHPPLTVGIVAALIRMFRRIPVVYDVQDMWPDTLRATGMIKSRRLLRLLAGVCDWVYRHVDHITVLSDGFMRLLMQRGVPAVRITVIQNWADEAALLSPKGSLPLDFPRSDRFRIVFAGNMGKAQSLGSVLHAAALLQKRNSTVCFVLVGGGLEAAQLKVLAAEMGLHNVRFLPPVPMAEVGVMLQAADALLVHLRKDPLFEITIPSKTQAYMAVGKPILMAVDGDAADLIRCAGAGVLAGSDNPEELAAAAEKLAVTPLEELGTMGVNAKLYYQEHLALAVGVSKFGATFRQIREKGLT